MMASAKNIVVNGEICSKPPCAESCAPIDCQLCYQCLSTEQRNLLIDSVSEHLNRGDTKRITPAPVAVLKSLKSEFWDHLSENNRFMARWYMAKCEMESSYCN